jgi:hypothetical protein
MLQQDLRAMMPSLANKTYFNNPALLKRLAQMLCVAMVLSDGYDEL